ncbi:cellulose binding domain-containing protein [Microbispora amethystogenes]|uniref:cellulose binding domain-containing protein n=1 Tax=Microbispora amethystogenes TaxID=1427754 RepID=UPI003401D866
MNIGFIRRHRRRRGLAALLSAAALVAASVVATAGPAQAADESITVNFSAGSGSPTYRASGWIYGMTENGANPPDHFFTDVKYRYMRAGGAQLDGPGGWVSGKYDRRWNATRAQLLRTRSLGGEFVLLVHDLWGADGYAISRFPGDNGNWTDYDNFLTRLINDVRATGVPVQWDLWNEPNITLFWNRTQSQYFEMWKRAYQRIRAAFPSHLIVGPSFAGVPSTGGWWTQYLDYVKANNVVPDIVSWHSLPGDPVANVATANTSLDSRGIAHPRPYQINEYGASNEQNPADGAWYIARLERAGADGLRANWAGGSNLHNDLANLLTHNSAGQYSPKGEWWVYRFYGSQSGQIASVTPSSNYDAFATKASGNAKVLVGGGRTTGNVAVNLQRLDTTSGVVQNNQVRVLVERVPYNGGGAVAGPVTVQNTVVTLSNNGTTVNLPHTAVDDTFTITLLPPDGSSPSPSPSPSGSPSPSPSASPSPSPSSSPTPPVGGCSATIKTVNSWGGGFQSEVTVQAGSSAVNGWTVKWTWPSGQSISSLWNGRQSTSGSSVTVTNESYNGSIAAGASTTFGFTANGTAATPTATCTSP